MSAPPSGMTPDVILQQNVNYWNAYVAQFNDNAQKAYQNDYNNWKLNDPYFQSKGIPHPPPTPPMLLVFHEDAFRQEWAQTVGQDIFDQGPDWPDHPGNSFTQVQADPITS